MTKEQLGVLILDCERQLYSTAKTILYSDQDCADAIQDTIVKAFSKIQTLKNDKYAKTWLIRILINECYTILRKSSKLTSLDMMDEQTKAEKIMMTKEKADYSELYQAINALKEELRLPVILYYIEDFNIREIAQILDITEGAVQKRLARASECYMSDVPTPFKNELPEYQEQEEHLLGIIYEKFLGSDLTEEEQKELKEIDHAMLWYDLEHLLGEIQYGEIPELHIDLDYTVRPFEEVEEEYLSLFEKYSGTFCI